MKSKKFIKNVPQLPVSNLRLTLDYYRNKLGFNNEWTYGDKDGGISRDELRLLFSEDNSLTNDINNKNHRLPQCGLSPALMRFTKNLKNGASN